MKAHFKDDHLMKSEAIHQTHLHLEFMPAASTVQSKLQSNRLGNKKKQRPSQYR